MKRSAILLVLIIVTQLFAEKIPTGYKLYERVYGPVTIFFKEKSVPRGEKPEVVTENPIRLYKMSEQYVKDLYMLIGGLAGDVAEMHAVSFVTTNDAEEIERRDIYVARITYKDESVKPRQTDSIQINGITGYTSSSNAFWQFPMSTGRVNLLSAHHKYLFLPLYLNSKNNLTSFPVELIPKEFKRSGRFCSEIADTLARFPRIFCAYDYSLYPELPFIGTIETDTGKLYREKDLLKLITAFNALPESAMLPTSDAAEIAMMTREIWSKSMETLSDETLQEVLKRDSTNVIGHLRFAEKQFHEGKLDSMAYHLDKAEQFSYENDYLVLTGKGLHAEHSQNYSAAEEYYTTALKNVPLTVRSSCRKELLLRLGTVRSAQKIANSEFEEEELELEL